MATLAVSGSGALRANISCALILLSIDNVEARRQLCGLGETNLIDVVLSMIQGEKTSANVNVGPKSFLSAIDAVTICDDREFIEDKGVGDDDDSDEDDDADNERLFNSPRFYGDLPPPSLDVLITAENSQPLNLNIICNEKETGIKMEVPTLVEIRHMAPFIAEDIAKKLEQNPTEVPSFVSNSYAAAEEFFTHITTANWASLRKFSNKYNLELCMELMRLAHKYKSSVMQGCYARLCYERVNRQNVFEILQCAIDCKDEWLTVMAFRCVVRDLDGVFAAGSRVRDNMRILEQFLRYLLRVAK